MVGREVEDVKAKGEWLEHNYLHASMVYQFHSI